MLTEKMEEYLEALFKLSREEKVLTPTRLAEHLKLTPPTVLDMLRRLEGEGYVRYLDAGGGKGKGRGKGYGRAKRIIALTPRGERAARTLVRRHRLSERFLTDVLGLDWEAAHREACRLEHVISPEVEEKLAEVLGNPETCPHGYPIPDENGHMEDCEVKPLCDFSPDEKGCIARVEEEEPRLLQYLASLGLVPDVDVEVKEVAPFGGPLLVKIGDAQYALGREVASKIWTRKGPGRAKGRGGPRHRGGGN